MRRKKYRLFSAADISRYFHACAAIGGLKTISTGESAAVRPVTTAIAIRRSPSTLTRAFHNACMNAEARTIAVTTGSMGIRSRAHPVATRDADLHLEAHPACIGERKGSPLTRAFFQVVDAMHAARGDPVA